MSVNDAALRHLESQPIGAPEGRTHLDMYEQGLDQMVSVNAEVGCVAFKEAKPQERQAISAAATWRNFSTQETLYLLSAAIDRLAELALEGYPVYRRQEGP